MKKLLKRELSEFVFNVGDMLMDYTQGEDGNLTDELAIGFIVSKKNYNDNSGMYYYVVDWTDCGREEYGCDNPNIKKWRERYIEYEKNNRLDNPESAAAGNR